MDQTSKKLANVLLVDDSLPEIVIAEGALERDNVHLNFFSVRGGEEALHYLEKSNGFSNAALPDLILLDLNMHDLDGRDVLKHIKEHQQFCNIPVIIYSASDAERDIEESHDLGATDYMTKTISCEKLEKAIKNVEHLELHDDGKTKSLVCHKK